MGRPRARDLGLTAWELPTGPHNAITDVAGVRVGHTTLVSGEGPLRPGHGPVRTGVTVVLPHGENLFHHKVRGAVHTINGFGKACGFEEVRELGVIEAPIALTNTLNVGLVADALAQYAVRQSPEIGIRTGSVNVVVGECNDGCLNDLQGRHVRAEHVWAAIETAASGPVPEGVVGAGTGTSCFGWKGGIGTASRVVPAKAGGFTVGALVQSNFGRAPDLTVCGVPVGRSLVPPGFTGHRRQEQGSVMIVLGTDAPVDARQLRRLSVRAAAGLARTGSHHGHGSGDFVIAFSTAHRIAHVPASVTTTQTVLADEPRAMAWLFPAVVESVEEAVLNSLCRAETVVGRDGNTRHAIPLAELETLVRASRPDLARRR
jgi:D-aminopeptidase